MDALNIPDGSVDVMQVKETPGRMLDRYDLGSLTRMSFRIENKNLAFPALRV